MWLFLLTSLKLYPMSHIAQGSCPRLLGSTTSSLTASLKLPLNFFIIPCIL